MFTKSHEVGSIIIAFFPEEETGAQRHPFKIWKRQDLNPGSLKKANKIPALELLIHVVGEADNKHTWTKKQANEKIHTPTRHNSNKHCKIVVYCK